MVEEWEQQGEEFIPLQIPPEYRHLSVIESKMAIRQLWQRYRAQEILLEPDFQRHYVWDTTRASRYIESLLLGLPTPPLFLAEEEGGRWIVVDGHQRLETLFRFMQPLLGGPSAGQQRAGHYKSITPLTLTSLEVMPELNGYGVLALTIEDRAKLWDSEVTIVLLPAANHPDMKYALFARLNLGSMSLNNQELRNCLYRGPYNNLIGRLSEDRRFLGIWGRNAPDKRMRHKELALRLFALLHRVDRYRVPYRAFLNDEMEANQDLKTIDEKRCRQEFECALEWIDRIFGKEALKRFQIGDPNNPAGRWINRRYDLLYEVEAVGFALFANRLESVWAGFSQQERQLFQSALRGRLVDVMVNDQFWQTLGQNTTSPDTVHKRFELWNGALELVLRNPSGAIERTASLHRKLSQSNVCVMCPQQVTPDDAVLVSVDGGEGVAHRFCRRNQRN